MLHWPQKLLVTSAEGVAHVYSQVCVCMFACVYVENMILRSNQYSIYSYLIINIDLSYQENSL